MKKKVFSTPADISLIIKDILNAFVGSLPKVWIDSIPKKQRTDIVKRIQQGFSLSIQELQKPNEALNQNLRDSISKNEHIITGNAPRSEKLELLQEYLLKTQHKIIPNRLKK